MVGAVRSSRNADVCSPTRLPRCPALPTTPGDGGEHTGGVVRVQALDDMQPSTAARAREVIAWVRAYCASHDYTLHLDETHNGRLTVRIGADAYTLELAEEVDLVDEVPAEDVSAAKYDWQRVSTSRVEKPSGRLHLQLVTCERPTSWADRTRWSLTDKLPRAMAELESRAAEAVATHARVEQAHAERVAAWERAVQDATAAGRRERQRAVALEQATLWAQARDLRAYAAALDEHPEHGADTRSRAWADLLRAEADRLDPLTAEPGTLAPPEDDPIPVEALDRHMPPGLTAAHPPDRRDHRW